MPSIPRADPPLVDIPDSYKSLPVQHIKISHYPEDAPTATPVIVVTLNRPKQRNAFTLQMMKDFELCYPMFDLDERVQAIVLTGSGDAFCAGADLDIGFNSGGERERLVDHRDSGGRLNLAIFRCRKPTIVALNGPAVGLGMTMTLAAAIRIAHASSKYEDFSSSCQEDADVNVDMASSSLDAESPWSQTRLTYSLA